MRNFNSSTLDNMVDRLEKVIVTADGEVTEYTPEDAARKIAGIVFRKYVEGQRIRTTFEYDYGIGAQLLQRASYDNGFVEKFEYVGKE